MPSARSFSFSSKVSLLLTVGRHLQNFFNPYALELLKALLFGDMSTLTETLLTEGIGLVSGEIPASEPGRSPNAQLRLVSLLDPPLRYRLSAVSSLIFRIQLNG